MAGTVTTKGTKFDPKLVKEVINMVKGKSSLAVLSKREPIPFNGLKEFVFSMDGEIDFVGENGKYSPGEFDLEPITIIPVKVEYGARVSEEFMEATEEEQLEILSEFNEGFANKLASGFDIGAFHGINPRTGNASSVIGDNHFDAIVTQETQYDSSTPDKCIETAIAMVEGSDREVNGMAIAPTVRSDLAAMTKSTGEKLYPDFAFGGQPPNLGANKLSINRTVSVGDKDEAIIGDFAGRVKWGYGKDITMDIIPYGDPDNTGVDLKGSGQIYIRCKAYIGWGIFDGNSFARIVKGA